MGAAIIVAVSYTHLLLKQGVEDFKKILKIAIKSVDYEEDCVCKHALDGAILSKRS